MSKAPNPNDILRLGAQTAAIKASMPAKRWAKFVKATHARGYTIGAALSDAPDALKERTAASLKAEAQKTVATAYAPATKALTTREAAIGYLNDKRAADDKSYRTWLTGETDKLNAQARAADATLATQQSGIAAETKTAIAAARADSIQRMGGTLSDPTQSTALDTSAADAKSLAHIGAAQEQTAAINKIGEDSRTLASASVLAQQAAREAGRQGDTWKALADVQTDRNKLLSDQAGATLDKTDSLIKDNATVAAGNRDAALASASLGLKQADSAQAITEANRKYRLETAKFGLEKWKADNAATVAKAKVDLGYAGIASREGVAAARRKLDQKLAEIRAAGKNKPKESKGVTDKERNLFRSVSTAQGLFTRWDKNNAVPLAERENTLRTQYGYDDVTIAIAHDLARNHGILSPAMRVKARQLGLIHSAYFWPVAPTAADTPPGGNPGR